LKVGDFLVESASSSSDVRVISWLNEGKPNILIICKVDQTRAVYFQGLEGKLAFTKIDASVPWENATLQFGEVNAPNPLILPGYAVALLSMAD
jgi:hypothetical protein